MPSNVLRQISNFDTGISVLATEAGLRSPRMLTIDPNYVPASLPDPLNPPLIPSRWIKSGSFISRLPTGYGRIFPTSRSTSITLTTSNTLTVKNASVFTVGDILRLGFAGATIGTIASIDPKTNIITLTANALVALAVGLIVNATVGGDVVNLYGMVISAVNIVSRPNDIAAYTSCTVYGDRLPFWSAEIATAFPEITFIVPILAANFP